MGGFCQLVELHREGSAPTACAAGLFVMLVIYKYKICHHLRALILSVLLALLSQAGVGAVGAGPHLHVHDAGAGQVLGQVLWGGARGSEILWQRMSKTGICIIFKFVGCIKHRKNCEKLPWEWSVVKVLRCFFTKRCHYNYFCHYCNFYYNHNLSFWVVTILFFLVLHNLSFWVWSNLIFQVFSQFVCF